MKKCSLMVFFISFLLCSCGGADYTYVDTNEQKTGPGLFSGEDGVFSVVNTEPDADKKAEYSKGKSAPE